MRPCSGPGGCLAIADYARHEPEKTLLHEVIRAELVPFLFRARSEGAPVARFVEREVRAYLECGVLAHGFLRVHCDACGHDRLVAFSCKGRGFYAGPSHRLGDFAALPPPETEDVARVLAGTARRILRLLERRGVAEEDDPLAGDDPLMAMLGAASIRSRIATGPEVGEPWRRLGDRVEPIEEDEAGVELRATMPPRRVRQGGMSLHADVAVPARDRQRLERLCRYVARPPLALGRLEALADGRLAYRLKTPWRDGTTHVVMERRELLERLAPLIPPPRVHQVRYHGVLAPCASGRDRVVPAGAKETVRSNSSSPESGDGSIGAADGGVDGETLVARAAFDLRAERGESLVRRIAWADLLKRVFEIDALRCPGCGGG